LPEAGAAGTVAIFSTCTGDYNFPSVPASAVRVLEKNGYSVVRPEQTCCGMPNLDGGDLEAMTAKARANVASLVEQVDRGRKIVVVQPTCGYMLKKEYPELLGTAEAVRVAQATVDVMELLDQLRREKKLSRDFKKSLGRVAYHAACHLRAQKMGVPGARILALLPDTEVEVVEQCSAVDGTWGMKASFYEMGRRYAQRLTRGMDAVGGARFVSDCSLAGLRILKENGAPAVHPIEAIAEAYGVSIATP
jgi:glycerol-3-phosphate dehydrogenase subunit C